MRRLVFSASLSRSRGLGGLLYTGLRSIAKPRRAGGLLVTGLAFVPRVAFASGEEKALAGEGVQRTPHHPPATHCVVLTGGPCGGKTSSLKHMTEKLQELGFDVFVVPEVPTILMSGGAKYPGFPATPEEEAELIEFEHAILEAQLALEQSFHRIASTRSRPSVVIFDRGVLDMAAYMPPSTWEKLLKRVGLTEEQFINRYNMVVHLVTAADGAEEHYTTSNNAARTEPPEVARELDKRIMEVWRKHPAHVVVGNDMGSFQEKLNKATLAVINSIPPEHKELAARLKMLQQQQKQVALQQSQQGQLHQQREQAQREREQQEGKEKEHYPVGVILAPTHHHHSPAAAAAAATVASAVPASQHPQTSMASPALSPMGAAADNS